jgi:hypothetical protein
MAGWVKVLLWVLSVVVGLPAAGLWVALKAKGVAAWVGVVVVVYGVWVG